MPAIEISVEPTPAALWVHLAGDLVAIQSRGLARRLRSQIRKQAAGLVALDLRFVGHADSLGCQELRTALDGKRVAVLPPRESEVAHTIVAAELGEWPFYPNRAQLLQREAPPGHERRSHPRFPLRQSVLVQSAAGIRWSAQTHDLSEDGACLVDSEDHDPPFTLRLNSELELVIPDLGRVTARVVRIAREYEHLGLGVAFSSPVRIAGIA